MSWGTWKSMHHCFITHNKLLKIPYMHRLQSTFTKINLSFKSTFSWTFKLSSYIKQNMVCMYIYVYIQIHTVAKKIYLKCFIPENDFINPVEHWKLCFLKKSPWEQLGTHQQPNC